MAGSDTNGSVDPMWRRRQLPANADLPRQSLVITSHTPQTLGIRASKHRCWIILALAALVCFWIVALSVTVAELGRPMDFSLSSIHSAMEQHQILLRNEGLNQAVERLLDQAVEGLQNDKQKQLKKPQKLAAENAKGPSPNSVASESHLVSRMPNMVKATADVRGNLGPATVVNQAKPGTDWIHDRWQAASNMHGKQIPGEHWIQLEFEDTTVVADRIVLDWETAYADEYVLEASLEPISDDSVGDRNDNHPGVETTWVLFDGRKKQDVTTMRSVTESGRSPGVKEPRPLHVVHDIRLQPKNKDGHDVSHKAFRFLRLHILKSVTGWGVSLWQFDVYGLRTAELQTSR